MERTDKASKNGFVQEGVDTVRVTVAMDGCAVAGELNDTLPARALARLLPLDLTFIGTGIALCAPLPVELPWDDALIHYGWRDGDINYSVQGGWLAVLCGDEENSGRYGGQCTIGHIEGSLERLRRLTGAHAARIVRASGSAMADEGAQREATA
ncbi:cyclophilin-like fold protein [Collinsella intestinalis]|uniref:cyclophilin-like fold protein n=1 Tax=Collinsella intestinalis TaxID=147207 RepID=UPI001958F9AB|nr:cyclophilin-like fold protein [Collinsella intestinalis]MBM6943090.1 hypothetical protein [Collinsella intestinalis]